MGRQFYSLKTERIFDLLSRNSKVVFNIINAFTCDISTPNRPRRDAQYGWSTVGNSRINRYPGFRASNMPNNGQILFVIELCKAGTKHRLPCLLSVHIANNH